jgi:hypothetical protein
MGVHQHADECACLKGTPGQAGTTSDAAAVRRDDGEEGQGGAREEGKGEERKFGPKCLLPQRVAHHHVMMPQPVTVTSSRNGA